MISLYQLVFGDKDIPTPERQKELSESLKALPENIFNAVHSYYIGQKSKQAIADETGKPVHLIERWLLNGVALLKVFHEAG